MRHHLAGAHAAGALAAAVAAAVAAVAAAVAAVAIAATERRRRVPVELTQGLLLPLHASHPSRWVATGRRHLRRHKKAPLRCLILELAARRLLPRLDASWAGHILAAKRRHMLRLSGASQFVAVSSSTNSMANLTRPPSTVLPRPHLVGPIALQTAVNRQRQAPLLKLSKHAQG